MRISLQRRSSGKPKTKKMRKFYTLSLIAAILTNISLTNSASAQYASTVPGGYFNIASSWDSNGIPEDKWKTITIPINSRIISNENFSWGGKITIHGSFIAEKDFTTGSGGVDVYGELTVKGKLTNGNSGASLTINNGARVIANEVDDNVRFVVENGGVLIVNGNCTFRQAATIKAGGRVEIFGDFNLVSSISIEKGGVLLVHKNFNASNNWSMAITGSLVVGGDFKASNGTINNDGNVIIGGDFQHLGGSFGGTNNNNFYLIGDNPEILPPSWNTTSNYGDLEDFMNNELNNAALLDLVSQVLPDYVSPSLENIWKGSYTSASWTVESNWRGKAPEKNSSVLIRNLTNGNKYPEIQPQPENKIIEINNLTIESGATLTLKPGAQLTVNGKLTIADGASLIMEHEYGEGGMSSLITNGEVAGKVKTKMSLPQDQWFYLGSSIKNAVFSNFRAGEDGVIINVYRSNAWWGIKAGLANKTLRSLEGMVTNYLPDNKDGDGIPDKRTIEYEGELHTDVVSRTFDDAGFHLLANPYASFISWQDGAGWERVNVDPTIWYRTKIGEEMTFVTYNWDAPIMGRITISPDGYDGISEDIVNEHSNLAPMQAVWIKTHSPNVTVNISPSSRNHGSSISKLKSSSASGNVIRVEAENAYSRDGAVIFFEDGFSEGRDSGDSEKYFNDSKNIPEVYTISAGQSLAISGLPSLTEDYRAISLSVRNRIEGNVTLRFDLRYFNNEYTAYLEDRYTGTYNNLLLNNGYSYTVETPGDVHDRFVLHLHRITTSIEEIHSDEGEVDGRDAIKIRSLGDKVLVSVGMDLVEQTPGHIEVYTIDGRKISEVPARSSRTFLILPQERGIYIVRAQFGQLVKSERVINNAK